VDRGLEDSIEVRILVDEGELGIEGLNDARAIAKYAEDLVVGERSQIRERGGRRTATQKSQKQQAEMGKMGGQAP
jgi:hypothetical protein